MKQVLLGILCLVCATALLPGCTPTGVPSTDIPAPTGGSQSDSQSGVIGDPNEEYVFMMIQSGIEYWNQHKNAMYDATSELGVKYSIVGIEGSDANDICTALDTVIAKQPAGIVIAGYYPDAFIPLFEKAWSMGVPVATTTIDVPDSKRLCFLGTNYYNYGKMMADVAAEACGSSGKVIVTTCLNSGQQSQIDINNGIKERIAEKYPQMQIVATLEDESDAEVAVQVISSALQSNPDAAVIIGTDAIGGVGAATALREVNLLGKIKIVCMDRDAPTLEAIKEGNIYATLAGKQYAEVYYAVKFLYDYNHNKVPLVMDNKANNVVAQPLVCDPGAIVIKADNVDAFLEYDINKIKDSNYK